MDLLGTDIFTTLHTLILFRTKSGHTVTVLTKKKFTDCYTSITSCFVWCFQIECFPLDVQTAHPKRSSNILMKTLFKKPEE